MKCPGEGKRDCGDCLSIARGAYADGLRTVNRSLGQKAAEVLAENANLNVWLEQKAVDEMSCAQRQHRAHMIGKQASLGERYKTDDGGR